MSYSLDYINEMVLKDPKGFVEECDRASQERVKEAADRICENLTQSPVVLLAGPSGSGKTTTAKKIEDELKKRGVNTHAVSMDNYFKTIDPETAPRTEKGDIDYESPQCLDMELLNEHFTMLAAGEEIKVPYFMFARQKRSASQFERMRLGKNEIAIFEGIHAFNDEITSKHPEAFKLYISVSSNVDKDGEMYFSKRWMRLVRRTVRDNNFRGADAAMTMKMWENVVKSEVKNILPHKRKANMTVDSSLAYEVPLMKKYALPLFEKLPEGMKCVEDMPKIISALKGFNELDEKYVKPDSLMREFIGGGIYKY